MNINEKRAVLELLRRSRGRIIQGWSQGGYAKDANGVIVGYNSDDAVCWCIEGAILADAITPNTLKKKAAGVLWSTLEVSNVISWNDHPRRTHEEVIDVYDRAIEKLEGELA